MPSAQAAQRPENMTHRLPIGGAASLIRERPNDHAPSGLMLRQSRGARIPGQVSERAPKPLQSEKTKLMAKAEAATKSLDAVKQAAEMEVSAAEDRANDAIKVLERTREQLEQARSYADAMQKKTGELENEQEKLKPALHSLLAESASGVASLRDALSNARADATALGIEPPDEAPAPVETEPVTAPVETAGGALFDKPHGGARYFFRAPAAASPSHARRLPPLPCDRRGASIADGHSNRLSNGRGRGACGDVYRLWRRGAGVAAVGLGECGGGGATRSGGGGCAFCAP